MIEDLQTITYPVRDLAAARGVFGAGAKVRQHARDVGGGRLGAVLADTDGNPIGLIQPAGPGA